MTNKISTPAIRFKGFTDAWEQRKFSDLAETRRGLTYKPSDISTVGIRVLRSSNIKDDVFIYGCDDVFVNSDAVKIPKIKTGDILVTSANGSNKLVGKHTIIKGLPDNSAVHGGFMLVASSERPEFTNALMSAPWYIKFINLYVAGGNGAIGNLNKNDLDSQDVLVPSKEEQSKIGTLFASIDTLITLHQRKLEKLQNIKKSMLEKMFPKKGSKYPEVRFKGFSDAWEQRELGDVGKAQSGIGFPDAEQGGAIGIPFFKVSDMNSSGNENEMTVANNYVTKDQIAVHRWAPIVELPAIFFAKVGAAVMLNRKRLCRFPFLLDNNTMAYCLNLVKWDADFAKTLFETVDLTSLVQVGALPSYNSRDVEKIKVFLPSLLEQAKIGNFFKQLDNLITLHQRELEKLKTIKKSMLEKMFA